MSHTKVTCTENFSSIAQARNSMVTQPCIKKFKILYTNCDQLLNKFDELTSILKLVDIMISPFGSAWDAKR